MKEKRNGFTLIELLAVIVILAIIALIATPIIMGVINDARKGAAQDSGYGYVKAVELAEASHIMQTHDVLNGTYQTKDGDLYADDSKVLDVSFKGTEPNDGGTVTMVEGSVTEANLTFGSYEFTYEENSGGSSSGGTSTPTVTYSIGDKVSVKGLDKTFHVMKVTGDNVLLLCDESVATTAFYAGSVHYASDDYNESTAKTVLEENTQTWGTLIAGAGGNTSGMVISIPSLAEIKEVRAHYGVTDEDAADNIDWLAASGGEYFTKTPSSGTSFGACIVVYSSYSHRLAGSVCAGSSYEDQVRPTLLINKSNLTKIS